MQKIHLSFFANAATLPFEVAVERQCFRNSGLDVELFPTKSSIEQMTGIIDGRYQIAATAIDNIIAYNEGQGAVATKMRSELQVFLGNSSYRLPFVVHGPISNFASLKGGQIAVDALSTGYAFLLRDMLESNGLKAEDYEFVSYGAPKERWEALKGGLVRGALLSDYFARMAIDSGCHVLTGNPDPWDNYQGNVCCAQRSFIEENPTVISAFTKTMKEAVDFTLDPANLDVLAEMLSNHLGGLSRNDAIESVRTLQSAHSVIKRELPISRSGTRKVMELRERFTGQRLKIGLEEYFTPNVTLAP
ncbi:ABC-type nitrate/sulfonate/bicarbonate transport system, periplasmic component [Hoeflea sp. IMCC20628]|uniref:ABC transporter substrate-binding protein n=1 Tax=Hoeflea sp. IMCC20628 TaxID=1620421 RepID=UPI00063AB601|nr:ABC transporter substrate-binding protein [Hoeflea sp. IMCC20628]AKH98915.1 ABC-type nitrate/sulfonate/bicarbonate transport system, periplasmic component [Hoeflea sp. IMCC20628]